MALDTERRATGIKNILRRLRGAAPQPLRPEDEIEGFMSTGPAAMGPAKASPASRLGEDEEDTSLGQRPVLPAPQYKKR